MGAGRVEESGQKSADVERRCLPVCGGNLQKLLGHGSQTTCGFDRTVFFLIYSIIFNLQELLCVLVLLCTNIGCIR